MGLEAPGFIKNLVTNWPTPQDKRREGDDHLRLIKQTLKNTFPNMDAAVTATPAALNSIPANVDKIIVELRKHIVPVGTIAMWHPVGGPPPGWVVCDGKTHPDYGPVPDLGDRFVLGASTAHAHRSVGGSSTVDTDSAGAHNHEVNPTVLTIAQMPNHTHRLYGWGGAAHSNQTATFEIAGGDVAVIGDDAGGGGTSARKYLQTNAEGRALLETTGAAQSHLHTTDPAGAHTHSVDFWPKYYALVYIIKVLDYEAPT